MYDYTKAMDAVVDSVIAVAILSASNEHAMMALKFAAAGNMEIAKFEMDLSERLNNIAEQYHESVPEEYRTI